MIIRGAGRERLDGEIDAGGLAAGELPIVQVRLMHNLGNKLEAPVFEPESLDKRFKRAVLAMMAEVRSEHVEWNALPSGIGSVSKGKLGVRIAEALDQPR